MPFLLMLLAGGKSVLTSVLTFLGKLDVWQLGCIALALFALVQHFEIVSAHRHSRKVETQLHECTAARKADQDAYTVAQQAAQEKNLADVARDKAERERITNDISQSYEAQLASLRADLARRLRQQNPAAPSASGGSGLPGVSPAPSEPDGEALPLPPDELLRAAETELQLNALIDWVNEQSRVNPNGPK